MFRNVETCRGFGALKAGDPDETLDKVISKSRESDVNKGVFVFATPHHSYPLAL